MNNPLRKIKLFSHTDLDGCGSFILCKYLFQDVSVDFCNYDDINEKINEFIKNKEFKEYDHIFITDISVNEDIAKLIDNTIFIRKNTSYKLKNYIKLIDHHKTALDLNKYSWCNIDVENEKGLCSGTSLFFDYLKNLFGSKIKFNKATEEFVELIRRYDTWEWFNIYKDNKSCMLNALFFIYGRERFIENILEKIKNDNFQFNYTDNLLLELEEEKKTKYLEKKLEHIMEINIDSHKVGVVEAEQHISDLGNYLAQERQDLDFIVILNNGKISYRGIKNTIDLSEIAKRYGGGGHKFASGSRLPKEKRLNYYNDIFKL